MGHDSDDLVSLPAAPPPNPAARRNAIDTALRKFDGIEDTAPARRSPWQWASSHRRATGGLVTAALIAVVGIPAIQVALRNAPQEAASERAEPGLATADVQPVQQNVSPQASEQATVPDDAVPVARSEPVEAPAESPAEAKEERSLAFGDSMVPQKARVAPVAPVISAPLASVAAAPPPPAPPPPPPAAPAPPSRRVAEREAADSVGAESDNIVVTGTVVSRQKMASPSPVTVINADEAGTRFQENMQSAFRSNSRSAILGLVGLPLQVNFNGDVRTYRTRGDVERDFDRIFTPEVRASVLSGQQGRHLTIARSGGATKIRAVRP